jgi:integrase/recombinase XerD
MSDHQMPLPNSSTLPETPDRLSVDSPLQAALGAFEQHMQFEGFSLHTVRAFNSDLRLFAKYIGAGHAIGDIGTHDLNEFLAWLLNARGVPCSPKSYARRVTSLKVFFGWLSQKEYLLADPAANVAQRSVSSPLPQLPTRADVEHALTVADGWRSANVKGKPDARPWLLLRLLWLTGIKKGEAMAIVPNHIVREGPDGPHLHIRYKSPRMRYKERKVLLTDGWLAALDDYLAQYAPTDTLFTCTARNLEYILHDIADAAGLPTGALSFENLRWASALNDYTAGVDHDAIRERLGISKITWRETRLKLSRLASRYDPDFVEPEAS